MARTSFKTFRAYLGLPGDPVEWSDRYVVSDPASGVGRGPDPPGALEFASYRDRILDIQPRARALPPERSPFPNAAVRQFSALQFNIADYGHTLMTDFLVGRRDRPPRASSIAPLNWPSFRKRWSSTAQATAPAPCGRTSPSSRYGARSPG